MARFSVAFLFSVLGWSFCMGQTATVQGVVTDANGAPLEGTVIYQAKETKLSEEDGSYKLSVPANRQIKIFFTRIGYTSDTLAVLLKADEVHVYNPVLMERERMLDDIEVIDRSERLNPETRIRAKELEFVTTSGTGVESLIKTLPGVAARSETSSQYSVRGGSFDENLVYVNGIEIYRPFLVRAGEQEGLSFINQDMVEGILFSAGGFGARYGDKMASVLDITYRKPNEWAARAQASLLGGSITVDGVSKEKRLRALVSARYRTNQLLLGGMDTDADFIPRFTDIQAYVTYDLNPDVEVSFLGNFSRNSYRVFPQSRQTNFGNLQEAFRLNVFFQGQENYLFFTRFGAFNTKWRTTENLQQQFTISAFQTSEQEYFDVQGYYRLSELNRNLGSDDFGEVALVRGVGGYQNYARNYLDAIIFAAEYRSIFSKNDHTLEWGVKYQRDDIVDRYKEWEMVDSANYSVPHTPSLIDSIIDGTVHFRPSENLELFEHFDSRESVSSNRLMAFLQYTRYYEGNWARWQMQAGVRSHYWDFNGQTVVSPRASIYARPYWDKDYVFRLSAGFYHQPPFYREMRDIGGNLNRDIRAQQSVHLVAGSDYLFRMWGRPFKWVNEIYYKDFRQLIPYELDNVRIRYSALNEAVGHAYGVDTRINGEFVKGTDSWASLSLFRVEENIEGDGAGYIPRPTDYRFAFSLFFQDYLPQNPSYRVSLTLSYVGGFPFGAPRTPRNEHVFRAPPYRRVDIGFIKVLKEEGKDAPRWLNSVKTAWVGVEIFNLIQVRNTVSYLWVRDISTSRQYAVPNFLMGRLLNLKLTVGI